LFFKRLAVIQYQSAAKPLIRLHRGRKKLAVSIELLPDTAFVRESQIVQNPKQPNAQAPLPFSSATLWRRVNDGSFPKPVKLSARVTAWRVGEIRKYLETVGTKPMGDAS
jgi:prophage regulatory protein